MKSKPIPFTRILFYLPVLLIAAALTAAAADRPAEAIYAQLCSNCHGADHEGGLGASLVRGPWKYGNSDAQLSASIKNGNPTREMPAWAGVLTDSEIAGMSKMLRARIATAPKGIPAAPAGKIKEGEVVKTELHSFLIETYVDGLKEPWGMAFLPDGRAIVTERIGELRIITNGKLDPQPITGVPEYEISTAAGGQAGLFDVAVHPDFAKNGFIYLSFAGLQPGLKGNKVNMTRLIRARLGGHALLDVKDIFLAPNVDYGTNGNFGGRIALDGKGYVYVSVGDRGQRQNAQSQNLTVVTGKIHRFHDDGRIPVDNPFSKTPGAIGSVWAYGVRNPQGLCFDSDGNLWETEHGMKGGDELNHIRKGLNYGWPLVTDGTDYGGKSPEGIFEGKRYTAVTSLPGMEPNTFHWTPSIAVSGLNFYTGKGFPKWHGQVFATSLAKQQLHRLQLNNGRVEKDEIIFSGMGRLRQFLTGPDGLPYVLRSDRISRLVPAE